MENYQSQERVAKLGDIIHAPSIMERVDYCLKEARDRVSKLERAKILLEKNPEVAELLTVIRSLL